MFKLLILLKKQELILEKAVDEGISKGAKSLIIDLKGIIREDFNICYKIADKLLPESTIMKNCGDSKGKETIEKQLRKRN